MAFGKRPKRAISAQTFLTKKFKTWKMTGEWEALGKQVAATGPWFIWAGSGSGKTTFLFKLCKYLSRFEKVLYNSREEGDRFSFQAALSRAGMDELGNRFLVVNEDLEQMKERMRCRKSAKIVVTDSFQHLEMTKKVYSDLIDEFGQTHLILIVSHADGKQPKGRPAQHARFDADIKIWVEGFVAFPASRFAKGSPIVINHDNAKAYWGEIPI